MRRHASSPRSSRRSCASTRCPRSSSHPILRSQAYDHEHEHARPWLPAVLYEYILRVQDIAVSEVLLLENPSLHAFADAVSYSHSYSYILILIYPHVLMWFGFRSRTGRCASGCWTSTALWWLCAACFPATGDSLCAPPRSSSPQTKTSSASLQRCPCGLPLSTELWQLFFLQTYCTYSYVWESLSRYQSNLLVL